MNNWITAAAVIVAGLATAAGPAAAQSGEASKGQRVFNTQCRSCHTVEKDGAQAMGPNLHGLFGRKAGTSAGYAYSDAMKNSGIVWDDTTLAEYNRFREIANRVYGQEPGDFATFLPNTSVRYFGRLDGQINEDHRVVATYQRLQESKIEDDSGASFSAINAFED